MRSILYFFLLCSVSSFSFSCQKANNVSIDSTEALDSKMETLETQDTINTQEAINMIKDFYITYTSNALNISNESFIKKNLTKGLIEKIKRVGTATNVDPIIRAQDFSEDAIETISVSHLDGNWFMVEYTWPRDWNVEDEIYHIPVRVTQIGNDYMIDYITPIWNRVLYGDSLLIGNQEPKLIDASQPLPLLKTFYSAYTMMYCSMPEGLIDKLSDLRAKHLTSNALWQFDNNTSKNQHEWDGWMNYDLLIDHFDFDYLWASSMKFTQLKENTYLVSYISNASLHEIILKVIKQDKEYRIDSIIKKEDL